MAIVSRSVATSHMYIALSLWELFELPGCFICGISYHKRLICFEATLLFQVISLYRIFTPEVFSRFRSLLGNSEQFQPCCLGLFCLTLWVYCTCLYVLCLLTQYTNICTFICVLCTCFCVLVFKYKKRKLFLFTLSYCFNTILLYIRYHLLKLPSYSKILLFLLHLLP